MAEQQLPLTPEQEIQAVLERFDVVTIQKNFEQEMHQGLLNKLYHLISKEVNEYENDILAQLDLIERVVKESKSENVVKRAYVVLGAVCWAEETWGSLPTQGALLELKLLQDDLVQVIAEHSGDVDMKKMFDNPQYILEHSHQAFADFVGDDRDLVLRLSLGEMR